PALQVIEVPRGPVEGLAVGACAGPHDLAADDEVDGRLGVGGPGCRVGEPDVVHHEVSPVAAAVVVPDDDPGLLAHQCPGVDVAPVHLTGVVAGHRPDDFSPRDELDDGRATGPDRVRASCDEEVDVTLGHGELGRHEGAHGEV